MYIICFLNRIHWHRKFNLNSTKVQPLRPVLPLDATEFTEAEEYKQCDKNLQQSLRWLSTVQIWSYFVSRSARHGYGKGKQLKQAAFLRNICYAQVIDKTLIGNEFMNKIQFYRLTMKRFKFVATAVQQCVKVQCTCYDWNITPKLSLKHHVHAPLVRAIQQPASI